MPAPAQVTLPSDREVRVTRQFNAPRQLVYDAHTKPELVQKWQTGYPGWDMSVCEMDVRVGGRYRIAMQPPEGDVFHLRGEFRVVEPPHRLDYTFVWEPPDPDDRETLVSLRFHAVPEGTLIALDQGTFATEARLELHRAGWTDTLERLESFLT